MSRSHSVGVSLRTTDSEIDGAVCVAFNVGEMFSNTLAFDPNWVSNEWMGCVWAIMGVLFPPVSILLSNDGVMFS
jgi:hypothetical protein